MDKPESLINTASTEEAVAHLEAFLFGSGQHRLWIVGDAGSGKSFLAEWARNQTRNGKRGAIYDGGLPGETEPFWAVFVRQLPISDPPGEVVRIGPPEYERKQGVLLEWASVRRLDWEPAALLRLLEVPTDNLQLLRSLAERAARQALLPSPLLRETDILRTLAALGYLSV